MNDELAQLFPTGKQITINGEEITVKPFKFGELPKVFKAIDPITGVISNLIQTRNFDVGGISTLIADGGDSIIQLMVIGSKKPREWVEDLEMDQGIEVITAIFEVNTDFFTQKVLPLINVKMKAVGPISQ